MQIAARTLGRVVLILTLAALVPASYAADRQRIQVENYVIQAVVTPQTHQLKAIARVKFTALDDISIATSSFTTDCARRGCSMPRAKRCRRNASARIRRCVCRCPPDLRKARARP